MQRRTEDETIQPTKFRTSQIILRGRRVPASCTSGSGAMLILVEAAHLPTTFSAGLPALDPRSVREAMTTPDADEWKKVMDRKM